MESHDDLAYPMIWLSWGALKLRIEIRSIRYGSFTYFESVISKDGSAQKDIMNRLTKPEMRLLVYNHYGRH